MFKVGETIYSVHAFPESGESYVEKLKVVDPDHRFELSKAVAGLIVRTEAGYLREISLQDSNVIPNSYNCHRIFKTEIATNEYINNPLLWAPKLISREEYLWGTGYEMETY